MFSRKDHKDNSYAGDQFFSSFATGIGDGLIVPYALLAGGASIVNGSWNILPFILLFTMLAALLMAGASYFTTQKEQYEKQTPPEQKRRDTKKFFANLDLPEDVQEQSVSDLLKENEIWDHLSTGQIEVRKSPAFSALITGISYFTGGFYSMVPFLFIEAAIPALKASSLITLPALFVIGFMKARGGTSSAWLGGLRLLLTGAAAAAAAFCVARLL
jgi:hypothetical protein